MSTTISCGYRVTSGPPLNLKKYLRGDGYHPGLNQNLDAIDARLSADENTNATQEATLAGQASAVIGAFQNLLGNGGFDHWQRDVSIIGGGKFVADLWKTASGFLGEVVRARHLALTEAPDGTPGPYAALIRSAQATSVVLYQRVSSGVGHLAGKVVQFGASLVTGNASRWRLAIKNSSDAGYSYSSYAAGTGEEERLQVSLTVAPGAAYVEVAVDGNITTPAADKVSVSDACLYVGEQSVNTFVPVSPLVDLYRVLRHYFRPSSPVYLPIADSGFEPKMRRPFVLPTIMPTTSIVQATATRVGNDAVPLSLPAFAGGYGISPAPGTIVGDGATSADAGEHLSFEDLVVISDPF